MKHAIVFLVLLGAFLFNSVVTTLPVPFLILLVLFVFLRESWVLACAFVVGVLLDISTVSPIGQTSLFYLTAFLFVLLYKRKYEVASLLFLMIFSFFSVVLYALIFRHDQPFISGMISVLLITGMFFAASYAQKYSLRKT